MDTSRRYYEDKIRDFNRYRRGRTLAQFCKDEGIDYDWMQKEKRKYSGRVKQDGNDSSVGDEDINLDFHKYHHSLIFRRLLYFYRRRIQRKSDAKGSYSVKIFIASGERIDNKINKINCRLNKKNTKS